MSSKLSLVRAKVADQQRMLAFLLENYTPDEPMCAHIGPEDEELRTYLRDILQGRTLIAVDDEDNLLGVAINGEVTVDEYNVRMTTYYRDTSEELEAFSRFWAHAEHVAGFWTEGEPTKANSLEVLCVGVGARGRGVGLRLIEASRELAREDGYPLFRMDCTSFYAARLAESAGMTCVFALPYNDYKNEKGEPVFHVKAPHDALRIFKQSL